jgi:hypothetical protein
LTVVGATLKKTDLNPEVFLSRHFLDTTATISYDHFNQVFSSLFSLPQESIAEIFSSLLIDAQ